jgi:hypothetical protein
VASLSDAGFVIEERRAPHVERANELWLQVFSRASVVQLNRLTMDGKAKADLLLPGVCVPPMTLLRRVWINTSPPGWSAIKLRAELIDWMETTPIVVVPGRLNTCVQARHF